MPRIVEAGRGIDPDSVICLKIPNLGFNIPDMGMKTSRRKRVPRSASLADALFTKVQQRVLGVLFGNPGRSFFANEVIALAGTGTGAVQRELIRLAEVGLVTVKRIGNQKHYQANTASPVFDELRGLVVKTSGIADVLRVALAPLTDRIGAAFVYGSVAKKEDTTTSDIDLMVLSDSLTYGDVFAVLEEGAAHLGRRVNPTVYSRREFARRIKQGNSFVTRVLAQPKIWLISDKNVLGA